MKTLPCVALLVMAVPLLLVGCKGADATSPKAAESKLYPIKGKVMAVDAKKPSVKLDHEDIPGLMEGMKMSFDVADAKLLEGLKEGDEVQGQIKAEGGKNVIVELKKR